MKTFFIHPVTFFSLVLLVTGAQAYSILNSLQFELGRIYPYLWFSGFVILAFNVSLIFVQSLYAIFIKDTALPEVKDEALSKVRVAILATIRNEEEGTFQRIFYSLKQNPGFDFWLLSDSDVPFEEKERKWTESLRGELGRERIFYRRRVIPFERKQGNIAEWFHGEGVNYDYFFVLDADSMIPSSQIKKLILKAEHPKNENIGLFQSAIYIAHDHTLFARAQAVGQYFAQRLYFRVNQAVFGKTTSFGHNCLIRSKAFQRIKLPEGILSHDNWETALLDREGYRTAFVTDTLTFEEATPHYLEERLRTRRWMKGSLQGWPILFMKGVSFPVRFLIFYQIYLYLVHPLLLLWGFLGLFCGSRWFQIGLFRSGDPEAMRPLTLTLCFTFLVLFGHKFFLARSFKEVKLAIFEVLVSTLVSLNNIFYLTWDLFLLFFEKLRWKPMAKDPNSRIKLSDCTQALFAGSALGLAAFLWGVIYSPYWTLAAAPVWASLILSIPVVYFTSRDWTWEEKGGV
jgi:membrane glycosyltransferase